MILMQNIIKSVLIKCSQERMKPCPDQQRKYIFSHPLFGVVSEILKNIEKYDFD